MDIKTHDKEYVYGENLKRCPLGYRWMEGSLFNTTRTDNKQNIDTHDRSMCNQSSHSADFKFPKRKTQLVEDNSLLIADCKDIAWKKWEPVELPSDAYLHFGTMKKDKFHIRDFANKYGMLTSKGEIQVKKGNQYFPVESWALWKKEIDDMSSAISSLICSSASEDKEFPVPEEKEKYSQEDNNIKDHSSSYNGSFRIINQYAVKWELPQSDNFKILHYYSYDVGQVISEKFRENRVFPTIEWCKTRKRYFQKLKSDNLLGMLWFQLSETLVANRHIDTCKECGKLYINDEIRPAREYCCSKCATRSRARLYRRRKKVREKFEHIFHLLGHSEPERSVQKGTKKHSDNYFLKNNAKEWFALILDHSDDEASITVYGSMSSKSDFKLNGDDTPIARYTLDDLSETPDILRQILSS